MTHRINQYAHVRRTRAGDWIVEGAPNGNTLTIYDRWLIPKRGPARIIIPAVRRAIAAHAAEREAEAARVRELDAWFAARPDLHARCIAWQDWRNEIYRHLCEEVRLSQRASLRVDLAEARVHAMNARDAGYDSVVAPLDGVIKLAWEALDEDALRVALDCADRWRGLTREARHEALNIIDGPISPTRAAFDLFASSPRGAAAISALSELIPGFATVARA